eukprot:217-Amorphochlora_amoeboformis.AAC.2
MGWVSAPVAVRAPRRRPPRSHQGDITEMKTIPGYRGRKSFHFTSESRLGESQDSLQKNPPDPTGIVRKGQLFAAERIV